MSDVQGSLGFDLLVVVDGIVSNDGRVQSKE
jgi:hypothetical protein